MIVMSVMTDVNDDYIFNDSLNAHQALWQMSIMTSVNCGVLDDRCLCCSPDSDVYDGLDDWDVSGLHKALDESDFHIFRWGLDDCWLLCPCHLNCGIRGAPMEWKPWWPGSPWCLWCLWCNGPFWRQIISIHFHHSTQSPDWSKDRNCSLPLWRVHEIKRMHLASHIQGLFIT